MWAQCRVLVKLLQVVCIVTTTLEHCVWQTLAPKLQRADTILFRVSIGLQSVFFTEHQWFVSPSVKLSKGGAIIHPWQCSLPTQFTGDGVELIQTLTPCILYSENPFIFWAERNFTVYDVYVFRWIPNFRRKFLFPLSMFDIFTSPKYTFSQYRQIHCKSFLFRNSEIQQQTRVGLWHSTNSHRTTWFHSQRVFMLLTQCVRVLYMYIKVTLYWGYLIILWLFHLGICCTVFISTCTVVVLTCFVMLGCVYVWVL